jgi:hypothetical protein
MLFWVAVGGGFSAQFNRNTIPLSFPQWIAAGTVGAYGLLLPSLEPFLLKGSATGMFFLLAPLGFALGLPFPSLLRREGGSHRYGVGILWGLNAWGSVAGFALFVVGSMTMGIRLTMMIAPLLYAASTLFPCSFTSQQDE